MFRFGFQSAPGCALGDCANICGMQETEKKMLQRSGCQA